MHFCGEGIAIDDNRKIIRIANAFAGEKVVAQDVSIRRKRQAYLMEIESACDHRCSPVCPSWRRCAACQFQGMTYDAQQQIKKDNWLRLIRKFVDIPEGCVIDFKPAAEVLAYRHRTDAAVFRTDQGLEIGIAPRIDCAVFEAIEYARKCNLPELDLTQIEAGDVFGLPGIAPVTMQNCTLHAPELNVLIQHVQCRLEKLGFSEKVRFGFEANGAHARVIVYAMPEDADTMRICAQKLSDELEISVIFQVLPPRGSHVYPKPESFREPWFCYGRDAQGSELFALKGAWTPVNPTNARLIRDALKNMIDGKHFQSVLELGCGCGTHTSLFDGIADAYVGIDASWPAILSAQHNAQLHQWKNVEFFTDTAEHYLDKRYFKGKRADAILMHSNRMPYSAQTSLHCRRFGAKTIYIVAPTAFAMAQECKQFVALGYELSHLTLCDTLPMTYHMMAAACLHLKS